MTHPNQIVSCFGHLLTLDGHAKQITDIKDWVKSLDVDELSFIKIIDVQSEQFGRNFAQWEIIYFG
jgi:hypothetical protein